MSRAATDPILVAAAVVAKGVLARHGLHGRCKTCGARPAGLIEPARSSGAYTIPVESLSDLVDTCDREVDVLER